MKKLIHSGKERDWYLIKEWVTKAGLKAHINQCVWSDRVKSFAPSLEDHYTGYVEAPEGDTHDYYNDSFILVHGGVTFCGTDSYGGEKEKRVVGFDMAHLGDEEIKNQEEYAEKECEALAQQIFDRNKKTDEQKI